MIDVPPPVAAKARAVGATRWLADLPGLVAATALCYAIGYPLALIGKSSAGWILVTLGGPLLAAVVWLFIRRVQS